MTEFRLRATLVALALAIAGCGADTKTGSNGTGITPPAIEPELRTTFGAAIDASCCTYAQMRVIAPFGIP